MKSLSTPYLRILTFTVVALTAMTTVAHGQCVSSSGIGGYDLRSASDRSFAFDYDSSGKLDHLVFYRPGTGTIWILKNAGGIFSPVYHQGDPGSGIGGYDLKSPADRAFAFDYDGTGKLDHLALYRPGTGTIWILKNAGGVFSPVYHQGDPGSGIGGYDLKSPADRVFAFDYEGSGKQNYLTLYRPGTGTIWILKNTAGSFAPVYHQGDPGSGIGGYDLKSPADQAFAFDYEGSGKQNYLTLYRPGTGTIWILKNTAGSFAPVYHQGDPGTGIGGYDLKSPADAAFTFDYESVGKRTYLSLDRPGTGTIWILKNTAGSFAPVYHQGDPGNGIGGYDLKSPLDQVLAFDFDGSGKQDHLVLYRPGTGTIWILKNTAGTFAPACGGSTKVVNMMPASLSAETNQDSEPFLAVQTSNPQVMVASAFTPNPISSTGNAPVYVSQDGGNTWVLNAITPVQRMTCDISHAMSTAENHPRGDLHAGTLACAASITLDESETTDVASSTTMNVQSTRTNVDQPFVRALAISNADRIYVGINDFNQPNGHTATVDVSVNGGTNYKSVSVETRATSGQDGPSVRPAIAPDNTVYAAFFGWRAFNGTIATSDVVVVRDDNGAAGVTPFQALKDPSDNLPGLRVVTGRTIPWSNAPTLGQERIGSTLSIAVDPNNSANVYVGWADRVGNGDIYTLHVRRSTDRGVTWSVTDLPNTTITNATNIALAVANNGVAGFLYQQLSNGRWITHLLQSRNGFATIQDTILANVPGNTPAGQFLPYLGDYDYLFSVGNEFRGVFCANNTPDLGNFPQGVTFQRAANFTTKTLSDGAGHTVAVSIDPFYFTVPVIP